MLRATAWRILHAKLQASEQLANGLDIGTAHNAAGCGLRLHRIQRRDQRQRRIFGVLPSMPAFTAATVTAKLPALSVLSGSALVNMAPSALPARIGRDGHGGVNGDGEATAGAACLLTLHAPKLAMLEQLGFVGLVGDDLPGDPGQMLMNPGRQPGLRIRQRFQCFL